MIKGLLIFFLVLLSSLFINTGCNKAFIQESDELKFSIEVDYENLCFIMDYDFGKEDKKFVETGFIYTKGEEITEKLTFDTENIMFRLIDMREEHKRCSIMMNGARDNEVTYTFRGYIKRSNGTIIYSSQQTQVKVNEGIVIMQIDAKVDLKNYKLLEETEGYNIEFTHNKDYSKVFLNITPNEGMVFKNRIEIFINDKLINEDQIKKEDNKIIITLDDPNWGPIF